MTTCKKDRYVLIMYITITCVCEYVMNNEKVVSLFAFYIKHTLLIFRQYLVCDPSARSSMIDAQGSTMLYGSLGEIPMDTAVQFTYRCIPDILGLATRVQDLSWARHRPRFRKQQTQ